MVTDEKRRIRIRLSEYGSDDPDPYQNVKDPETEIFKCYFLTGK
jgi:hypothetical protein